jgi:hypothetical protein
MMAKPGLEAPVQILGDYVKDILQGEHFLNERSIENEVRLRAKQNR